MGNLTFEEKIILVLYKKFYGEEYSINEQCAQKELTDKHVKAQKLCYLLSLYGLEIGGYNYSWDTFGPYSPRLQACLHELDRKYDDVRSFYNLQLDDSILFSNSEGGLFWESDKIRIDSFFDLIKNPDGDNNRDWMELLGSLAYLFHNVFPQGDFSLINEELVLRKNKYNDTKINKKAWSTLLQAKLLSI